MRVKNASSAKGVKMYFIFYKIYEIQYLNSLDFSIFFVSVLVTCLIFVHILSFLRIYYMPREMATYPAFLPPHWSFPLPTVDLLNPPPPQMG